MDNIICDTNIWYDIANGNIKPEKIKRLNLVGTAVNVVEIGNKNIPPNRWQPY